MTDTTFAVQIAALEAWSRGHEALCDQRAAAMKDRLEEAIAERRRQVAELRAGLKRIELTMYGGVLAMLAYLAQHFLLERLVVT